MNTRRIDRYGIRITQRENKTMWYFAWILGIGFAVLLAILNAMWGETEQDRAVAVGDGAKIRNTTQTGEHP